jgi:murein DD-endopeptidase MepM/ murein hydrolase activator NlpD
MLRTRADKILAGFLLGVFAMAGIGLLQLLRTRETKMGVLIVHGDQETRSPVAFSKPPVAFSKPPEVAEAENVDAGGPTPQVQGAEIAPEAFHRNILIPVQGVSADDIQDTFDEARGPERKHEATDILSPRGTPVLAADNGEIKKLFSSKAGGLTLYQFDSTGQYSYYYAHLDRYADDIREGKLVRRGDVIGYVGTTGNAPPDTPHLHFGIFKLGPEKRWWEGTPINPYPILIQKVP